MQILDFRFDPIVKISIIIVSYNVKLILEQCLCSIQRSIHRFDQANSVNPPTVSNHSQNETTLSPLSNAEVIVVDNNSRDGTIEFLNPLFPSVKFIANVENKGFSSANNQALHGATGELILFLNPDTILPEDFFLKVIPVIEMTSTIGALGVQMINGSGKYLEESKRGFPKSWVSFCKLSGLTSIFPRSRIFAKYYLGHLDKEQNHEVQALSGACMLVRKNVLDDIDGFDERFFMYAEDIDLSYRISKAGYRNFYFAKTTIIHFKGESTTRDKQYVKLFYKAMLQFVEKHYRGPAGKVYAGFLKFAIGARALFAFGNLHLNKGTANNSSEQPKYFLMGDEDSMNEVRSLYGNKIILTDTMGDANQIVLCEGKDFPFSKLIDTLKNKSLHHYRIHAFNSSGFVGR